MGALKNVDLILKNAHELITCKGPVEGVNGPDLDRLECIRNGALAVDAGRIVAVGKTATIAEQYSGGQVIDCSGCLVSPGLVDPHTHLIYAGSRHEEYQIKVTGKPSSANLESGIRYTVDQTRSADAETLVTQALKDLDVMAVHGTTTVEAKTGYGLSMESEKRLMRLTAGLEHAVEVVPTFMGAHVLPSEYDDRRDDYVELIVEMLPDVVAQAEYCDVCCDPVGFTSNECIRIGSVARDLGMRIRVHADQTGECSGALTAAKLEAVSADHLDYTTDEGFAAMAAAGTVATFLPGVTHHMMEMTPRVVGMDIQDAEKPFMPLVLRRAINAGACIALSTDYNPGTCPTPSMQEIMWLAARLYRLSYAEIWHMCTINAAKALDRSHDRGSLETGKRADIVVWSVPEHGMVINRFGVNLVDTVIINGQVVAGQGQAVENALRNPIDSGGGR
jgi:imidazolonepropionase